MEYAVKNVGMFKVGDRLKALWLYYYLNSGIGKDVLNTNRAGTSQPYLTLGSLRSLPILVPDRKETMENAVAILSALDEKIELNRQANATLEAIAQTIFKEWFVDFQFPGATGEMQDSELGPIPRGWRTGKVQEICEINRSVIAKRDHYNCIDYIEISEVNRGRIITSLGTVWLSSEVMSEEETDSWRYRSSSTVRPNRGSFFLAIDPPETLIASTGFAVFSPTRVPFSYLYLFLTDTENWSITDISRLALHTRQ